MARKLAANRGAPGTQAALCALGELGAPTAAPFLLDYLQQEGDYAYEAALSLGKLRAENTLTPLREFASDPRHRITNRTAAACALLDLGESTTAVPILSAVLLAGTPYGRELATAHSIPTKSRWALERQMAIDAIERFTGGETFGLDPDNSWPRLSIGVEALQRYVEDR